ncbi:unnamed protein product, partial [marine sediment metagenome]
MPENTPGELESMEPLARVRTLAERVAAFADVHKLTKFDIEIEGNEAKLILKDRRQAKLFVKGTGSSFGWTPVEGKVSTYDCSLDREFK